jgi:hypothetical protein
MGWSALTLVTDSDLGMLEPEATNGHWKTTTWPNQRAEAKRDLKIRLETDYANIPNVADKIKDTHKADAVWGYTGSTYTDWTAEAESSDEDDLELATIFTTFGTDKLYIGHAGEFDAIQVQMLAALNAIASVMTAKYSGSGGWTSLTITDGTSNSGKAFGKGGRITWTMPTDWQRRTLNNSSDAYFWIELTISAALTASTAASQVLVVKAPDGLKRFCAFQALGYIYTNLAAQAPSTDYWAGRARNQFKTGYFDLADALYAQMRDKGGIPIDLDDDGAISPDTEAAVTYPLRISRA